MILILRQFLLVTFLYQSLLFVEIQAYRNEATYIDLEVGVTCAQAVFLNCLSSNF
jgi:hypothetical protein